MTNRTKYKIQMSAQLMGIIIGLAWVWVSIKIYYGNNESLKAMSILTFIMGIVLIGLFSQNFLKLRKAILNRISALENGVEIEAEIISITPKLIGRPPFYEWKISVMQGSTKTVIVDTFLSAPSRPEHSPGGKVRVKIIPNDLKAFYLCD